ncbi:MAG: HDOD domain-containing protein [Desulfobacter sp.]|nr:HDOD domain-containing protein [Desulfobacter sp.]
MKILIVDDEKISRKILVSKMKSLGPCVAVDSSIKAMAEIEMANSADEPFDIITLDVSMPGMDGKQILEHIRRQEIKKKIPKAERVKILMVTSRMNMNTIKACIKLGCNGYLTKPVSRVQLLENLGKMGFDTLAALKEGGAEKSHTAVVADLINRLYFGKVDLPVFPGIVQEVEAHIKGKDPSIEDLAKIVEKDIVISTRLIFIANSPLYKGVETVDSLNAALLRLGLKTARAVITAIAAKALFDTDKNALKTEMARLWLHSFATATLGKHLAEAVGNTKAENIFLMGIVHDIGKMLLMKTFADIYPEDDIADKSLQLAIHEIHTTFGAVLLKRMRFSKAFVQVAEFHHLDRYEKDADQDLVIICLADRLAHEFGFGFMEHQDQGIPGKIKSGSSGMFRILCHGFGSRICLGASGSKSQVREWAFNLPRRRSWLLLERSSWNHLFHL